MAMITCKKCSHEMSDTWANMANQCQNCKSEVYTISAVSTPSVKLDPKTNGLAKLISSQDNTVDVYYNFDHASVSVYLNKNTNVQHLKLLVASYISRNLLQDSYKTINFFS